MQSRLVEEPTELELLHQAKAGDFLASINQAKPTHCHPAFGKNFSRA